MSKQKNHLSTDEEVLSTSLNTTYPPPTMLSFHPFPGDLTTIHIWPHVTTPTTVVYTWPQVTPTTQAAVVTTARSTNGLSGINDLDNDPTEVKYLGLPTSQLDLKKPLE